MVGSAVLYLSHCLVAWVSTEAKAVMLLGIATRTSWFASRQSCWCSSEECCCSYLGLHKATWCWTLVLIGRGCVTGSDALYCTEKNSFSISNLCFHLESSSLLSVYCLSLGSLYLCYIPTKAMFYLATVLWDEHSQHQNITNQPFLHSCKRDLPLAFLTSGTCD